MLVKEKKKVISMGKTIVEFNHEADFQIVLIILWLIILILDFRLNYEQKYILIRSFSIIFIFVLVLTNLIKSNRNQQFCDEGIISNKGIYKWKNVKSYYFIESLNSNKIEGISITVENNNKTKEFNLFFSQDKLQLVTDTVERQIGKEIEHLC
jgi:hypothetical protein